MKSFATRIVNQFSIVRSGLGSSLFDGEYTMRDQERIRICIRQYPLQFGDGNHASRKRNTVEMHDVNFSDVLEYLIHFPGTCLAKTNPAWIGCHDMEGVVRERKIFRSHLNTADGEILFPVQLRGRLSLSLLVWARYSCPCRYPGWLGRYTSPYSSLEWNFRFGNVFSKYTVFPGVLV